MNTKYAVLALIIIAVVVGGWYYLAPDTAPAPATDQPVTAAVKTFSLVVKDRALVSGESVLTVKQGDTVSITITADESDELHIHGYDQSVEFEANTPATLTFTADQSGRFPFELEGSKTDLGEIQVQP